MSWSKSGLSAPPAGVCENYFINLTETKSETPAN